MNGMTVSRPSAYKIITHLKLTVMNIVLSGFTATCAAHIAERYHLKLRHSLDELDNNCIILLPRMESEEQRLQLFGHMAEYEDRIDAVIGIQGDDFSTVHYCSQPGKFFSVNGSDDDQVVEEELSGIIETKLGNICAHEGLDPDPA